VAIAAVTPVPVQINVDADSFWDGAPFEHKWKRSFGSGHASLTVREDWRAHLAEAHTELGASGVRYHGIFDDDHLIMPELGSYNFSRVTSTWDYLQSLEVRPIVELSFMPAFVANCTWHGHCPTNPKGCTGYHCTQCSGHGVGPVVNPDAPSNCSGLEFWYQGIRQVPYEADYERWYDLVKATVSHAVERYGLAEVQRWSFEVWNELWGLSWPGEYMALYNASAHAVKAVHPSLKVGGPATAVLAHVKDFVSECEARGIPYDFVSTHHYPTDDNSCPKGDEWDPDCFSRQVLASRASVAPVAFYLTEYNVGCCLGYVGHDIATAAAFIFRTVGALNDEDIDVYSYWTFTDVFEEGGLPEVEFKNIYGMKTISGVPKPAWRAFQLLHTHAGTLRLPVSISNQTEAAASVGADPARAKPYISAFATCNASTGGKDDALGSLRIFVSFWAEPEAERDPLLADRTVRVVVSHPALEAGDAPPSAALIHIIDDEHVNPSSAWVNMGSPDKPTPQQLSALLNASAVHVVPNAIERLSATTLALTLTMQPNSAAVVSLQ